MAVNMDKATPINKVRAKPLTIRAPSSPPSQKRTRQAIKVVMLLSLIAVQARLNPASTAAPKLRPPRISSLMRSKIRTLASTAMPSDRMKPATPGKVRVTGTSLKMAKSTTP